MTNATSQPRRRDNNQSFSASRKQKEVIDHSNYPLLPATVKFFNHERGYGFVIVQQEDGTDKESFVHITTLEECGIKAEMIQNDTPILVKHHQVPKGDQVVFAKLPDDAESTEA